MPVPTRASAVTRTLAAAAILVAAVTPAAALHFERIGSEGGPPPSVITALHQDRDGFLWIGSRNGLILFDGYSYTTFQHDPSNAHAISDHVIRTIHEDRDGTLWLGTNTGGLNRFDPSTRTFVHYRHDSADPRSLSHDSVYAILDDGRGHLWIGTQKGLNRLDRGADGFVRILAGGPEGLANDYVLALYQDRAGTVWVGTLGGGLHRWDDERGRFEVFRHAPDDATSLPDDRVTALLEDEAGTLWVGTFEGLSRAGRERDGFRTIGERPRDPRGFVKALVTSLAPGGPGRIWVGTHGGGLAELDTATGEVRAWRRDPADSASLSEDVIIALLTDRAGSLWIGTWGGGLDRLSHATRRSAGPSDAGFPPDGVPDRDVMTILEDRRGRLWVGTRTGYLVRLDPATGRYDTILRGGDSGFSRILLDLEEDRRGRVWIATNGELMRIEPGTGAMRSWEHDPGDPRSIGPGYVTALLEDTHGRLWVGTGEGGLNRLDANGTVLERHVHDPQNPETLSDDYVTTLLEDGAGRLWVGTRSGGLNELDPASGRVRRFVPAVGDPDAIGHHHVTALLEDARGRLWVGTAGGGLNRVERAADGRVRFERVTEQQGLVDDDVTAVLEDDDGSLWIATRRGMSRFDPESNAFHNLFVSDGLPSAEFEAGAAARGHGRLCFGAVRGLVQLESGTPFERPSASPVVVRSIQTAQGEVPGRLGPARPDRVELPYGTWMSIELAVLDYSPELEHRYAYRLGDEWIDVGDRREITFTTLEPGTHELGVRARNSQGVWSEAASPLEITVVPPFWMTLRFRLLVVTGALALAFGWHWRRTSVLARRNRELVELHRQREKARQELDDAYQRLRRLTRRLEAAKEDERLRIARELHDEMGPSLTAVIINLQLLAAQKEPEKLARRIDDTVDLVDRMVQRVRDLSLDLRPPLIDELGLVPALGGYLESVSERTGLRIEVGGDADLGPLPVDVPITAFRVVQEAVTNAVRHAGAGRVAVHVHRNEAGLDVRIEDDGRGFDVRETMERAAAGKALGLLGMQERVGMLDGKLDIDSAPGAGTRIRVRLPLSEAA